MKTKTLFLVFLLLILISSCNSQQTTEMTAPPTFLETVVGINEGWKEGKIPISEKDWYKANYSDDIGITLEDNRIIAADSEKLSIPDKLEVGNGFFKGVDNGEWGGSIEFITKDGTNYKILKENFRGFYTKGEKKFVLTGMDHLDLNSGYIYELIYKQDKWVAEKVIDIKSYPYTFTSVNDELYIVTSDTLIVVKDGEITNTLVENAFWKGLYPNSMIYANNSIYIGMRGGMYLINLENKEDKWYDLVNK